MAAVPAVRAMVKTELSYRNGTIIVISFVPEKDKDIAKVALDSSNNELKNLGFILTTNGISCSKEYNYFPILRHSTSC